MFSLIKRINSERRYQLDPPETAKKVKLEEVDESNRSTTVDDSSIDSNKLESMKLMFKLGENQQIKQTLTQNDQKISTILSKPSLRERYANTCFEEKHMLKISKYQHLIEMISVVDLHISFMKQRNIPSFFNQLKQNIKENNSVELNLTHIQQIQSVWNEAYVLKWTQSVMNHTKGREEIQIQFFNNREPSILQDRRQIFSSHLSTYLKTNGDYIEEYPLPLKTVVQEVSNFSIQQILQKFRGINQGTSDMNHDIVGRINLSKFKNLKTTNSGLSEKLLQQVQEKQKEMKQDQSELPQFDFQQVQQVVSIIYNYYLVRSVSNMFLVNVISYVVSNKKKIILDQSVVKLIIESLTLKCPSWLSFIDNKAGRILRMNKSVQLPTIMTQMQL